MAVYLTRDRKRETLLEIDLEGKTIEGLIDELQSALTVLSKHDGGYVLEADFERICVVIERDEDDAEFAIRVKEAEISRIRQERFDRERYEKLKKKFEAA